MPLYGFICQDCGEEFEELILGSSSTDDVCCPKCNAKNVERQLSLIAAMSAKGSSSSLSSGCAPSG